MSQAMPSAPAPAPQRNNTPLIIAAVVIIGLCFCCVIAGGLYYLYQNGDQIFGTGALLMRAF